MVQFVRRPGSLFIFRAKFGTYSFVKIIAQIFTLAPFVLDSLEGVTGCRFLGAVGGKTKSVRSVLGPLGTGESFRSGDVVRWDI